jgi:hypothetical protein
MVAFWLRSGRFLLAFWWFALCCGWFAPTNALRCGIFSEICYGICFGICLGIFGQQLPAVWLRSGRGRLLSGSLLFASALVLLRTLFAKGIFCGNMLRNMMRNIVGNI